MPLNPVSSLVTKFPKSIWFAVFLLIPKVNDYV